MNHRPSTLVTGGAGFLGSHLAAELLVKGHSVVVLDDLSGGYGENVPPGALFVQGSILDTALLARLFAEHGFDYVFHFAAYAAEILSHHIKRFNYMNNLIGSVNLINESVAHKIRCFVFASSAAVYGAEDSLLSEDLVARPEDPYGIAKLAVEQELRVTRRIFGLDSIVFRLHNVYGERQNTGDIYRNVVSIFLRQAILGEPMTIFGDGRQTRAFTYVGDIVPCIAGAIDIPAARNRVVNLGGEGETSINELASCIAEVAGVELRAEHLKARSEAQRVRVDHSLARELLGFAPKTPLREGMRRMLAWLKTARLREKVRFTDIELEENLPAGW
jgi:UDP-glucose 4-epimerase